MLSAAKTFEIRDIQEDEIEAVLTKEPKAIRMNVVVAAEITIR